MIFEFKSKKGYGMTNAAVALAIERYLIKSKKERQIFDQLKAIKITLGRSENIDRDLKEVKTVNA